jgi:cytochrome c5
MALITRRKSHPYLRLKRDPIPLAVSLPSDPSGDWLASLMASIHQKSICWPPRSAVQKRSASIGKCISAPCSKTRLIPGSVAPNLAQAELEDQVAAPGLGSYPNLKISLLTYNGLIFSPATNDRRDIANGNFFFANNAMSAWQNSLVPPPNKSVANRDALASGSADRGAKIFEASCLSCHHAPFFTDNRIHPIAEINTNPARAKSRLNQNALLVPPQIYSFDTPVPIPANATVLTVPTEGIADKPNLLPKGLLPDGGYKTPSLLGLYLTAPYLHDGGVAVRKGALAVQSNGTHQVADPSGLGLSGTLSQGILPDAASSLRALIDRPLRQQVIAANQANPALQVSNLDGRGHDFYIEGAQRQEDLINFLLALDNNPAEY